MHNNLSPEMQARLDKWKEGLRPPKNADLFKSRHTPSYVARKGDFGDDLSEVEKRQREHENNKGMYGTARK